MVSLTSMIDLLCPNQDLISTFSTTVVTEIFESSGVPHTKEHLRFMASKHYSYSEFLDRIASRLVTAGVNAATDVDNTTYIKKRFAKKIRFRCTRSNRLRRTDCSNSCPSISTTSSFQSLARARSRPRSTMSTAKEKKAAPYLPRCKVARAVGRTSWPSLSNRRCKISNMRILRDRWHVALPAQAQPQAE